MRQFTLFLVVIALVACQSGPEAPSDLDMLTGYMTGSFDSAAQAASDSTYFDIKLHMVSIWAERTDGHWMYVEQAASEQQDRPYRQRVYQVTQEADGRFKSAVFTMPEPLRFAGAWQDATLLNNLTPEILEERTGCAVYLEKQPDGTFAGETAPKACGSVLRGATYATSSVIVTPTEIRSWDQGFNAEDEQVWGATEGPYIFVKQ